MRAIVLRLIAWAEAEAESASASQKEIIAHDIAVLREAAAHLWYESHAPALSGVPSIPSPPDAVPAALLRIETQLTRLHSAVNAGRVEVLTAVRVADRSGAALNDED